MDVTDWNSTLSPNANPAIMDDTIVREVAAVFEGLPPDVTLSTMTLVERLYPLSDVRGPQGLDARARLTAAILRLAKGELGAWATVGEPDPTRKYYGRPVRPWQWHAKGEVNFKAQEVLAGRKLHHTLSPEHLAQATAFLARVEQLELVTTAARTLAVGETNATKLRPLKIALADLDKLA